jgi:uncharacterized protein
MRIISSHLLTAILISLPLLASAQVQDTRELEQRALSGDVEAQLELAQRYDLGTGVRKNRKQAEKWFLLAAQGGNANAQNSLGSLLQERDKYIEARAWYEKAALQSHPQATNNLAYLYDLGLGVAQDRQKGKELYLVAARLGWGEAMWNLAIMAAAGQAGPVDWFATCVWTSRALNDPQIVYGSTFPRVSAGMREVEGRLSESELARCEQDAAKPLESVNEQRQ